MHVVLFVHAHVGAQLDYYDVSLEILAVYLQSFPTSAVAVNLKACNHFRLYNGAHMAGGLLQSAS
jgi:hypothetical protein